MQLPRAHPHSRKVLVFRLSSLGDVILASSILDGGIFAGKVDWVVAAEFAPLLRGHPRIGRLWEFSRSEGLGGWLALCAQLRAQDYDEVLDLHASLRTKIARLSFLCGGRAGLGLARWRTFSKARWRVHGLYLFKRHWPAALRPGSFVARFARFAGGTGRERPDLTHLVKAHAGAQAGLTPEAALPANYYCVMPGSKWRGKCWPAAKYLEVIRVVSGAVVTEAVVSEAVVSEAVVSGTGLDATSVTAPSTSPVPVILGGASDVVSRELVDLLASAGLPHQAGVGRWSLPQVAQVLSGARAYLGNDTGLAHLAEAVGIPALVVYGPTTPEMGFAPWRPESVAAGWAELGCRPCGKDGRRCYRPVRKYLCLTGLGAAGVAGAFRDMIREKKAGPS